jgi:hypothetical protein
MSFERFHTANTKGHRWNGQIEVTSAPFRVIARPNLYRRQLHFENPVSDAPNHRKRKGGTVTPFGFALVIRFEVKKLARLYGLDRRLHSKRED